MTRASSLSGTGPKARPKPTASELPISEPHCLPTHTALETTNSFKKKPNKSECWKSGNPQLLPTLDLQEENEAANALGQIHVNTIWPALWIPEGLHPPHGAKLSFALCLF